MNIMCTFLRPSVLRVTLSVAGSDCGGGAGIQADIKTFSALGVFGCSVITAVTAQNTSKVIRILPLTSEIISSQFKAVMSDFKLNAVKVGMVYDAEIMKEVCRGLKNATIPIVVDPLLVSGTGFDLILKDDLENFKELIIPISYLLTPNLLEAEVLSGMKINSEDSLLAAANILLDMGAKNVIIKGGHSLTKTITDFLLTHSRTVVTIERERLKTDKLHGTGCNFSAAVAAYLAGQTQLENACKLANAYVYTGIASPIRVGRGSAIVDPSLAVHSNSDRFLVLKDLEAAVEDIESTESFGLLIPQTQTNIAYSVGQPVGLSDVAAVNGRIARIGDRAKAVDRIRFGASKHVASAILSYMKKNPLMRSAINIRYDLKLLEICRRSYSISSYDRQAEPQRRKETEGMSIEWGIRKALEANSRAEVIYHLGDMGKEPMIVVFDKNPVALVKKINSILKDFLAES
jgi:hydroxymethylpyrimidine kinase / phosphomethylpyrimidine kinase / thiamine-phosphate diphosphorylase